MIDLEKLNELSQIDIEKFENEFKMLTYDTFTNDLKGNLNDKKELRRILFYIINVISEIEKVNYSNNVNEILINEGRKQVGYEIKSFINMINPKYYQKMLTENMGVRVSLLNKIIETKEKENKQNG
jgi:hypothetical protein